MTGPQFQSTEFNPSGYPFFTGNVAMSENYLWSTYGVADAGDDWDMAATPSYQGQTTAAFNADTFRILKDSKHPDEAFKVLTYLLGDGRRTCSSSTAACPPVRAEQDAFFAESAGANYPQTIDWNVAKEGVKFADVPELRVVHARLQRDARPAQHLRHEVAGDPGPGPRHGDRRPQDPDAGHLGPGRQLTLDDGPQRRASARPARLLRAGLAARALGVRLHRAVDHRVPRVHAHPDDRDARASRSPTST